jgi:hypothetical protein
MPPLFISESNAETSRRVALNVVPPDATEKSG